MGGWGVFRKRIGEMTAAKWFWFSVLVWSLGVGFGVAFVNLGLFWFLGVLVFRFWCFSFGLALVSFLGLVLVRFDLVCFGLSCLVT